jgi:CelD/BcsL family acetyltransferase involved in cellulose biosynthesis
MAYMGSAVAPSGVVDFAGCEFGPSGDLHVEVVSDPQEFAALEPLWNQLIDEARPGHPFLEHSWVRTWWECFGHAMRLQILLVTRGGRVVAIAPLVEDSVRMFGVTLRRLGFFYNSHVPRQEFLVAQYAEEAYTAIWNHLGRGSRWDILQLNQLEQESRTLREMELHARAYGRPVETWLSGNCPYVPVRASFASWSQYLSSLPAKHRSNLRNRMKRLSEAGSVEIETIDSHSGLAQALDDGIRLESAAWKGEEGTAIGCDPNLSRFYRDFARQAAERGWLRLHFLKAGGERVAFDYSLQYRGRMFLLKHGYHPDYARLSPSQLLLQGVLECAFGEGLEEYEILGDNTEWKQNWTSEVKKHYWLFAFSNSWRAGYAHAAKFRAAPLLKRVLGSAI